MTAWFLGIAGGSGSGKTELATALRHASGGTCALLPHDAYYHPLPDAWRGQADAWNFDAPDALDSSLLVRHLAALRAGRSVDVPVYDFERHARVGSQVVDPTPLVVVEGILLLAEPALVDALDLRVFVDTPADVRLARRTARDVAERGRTAASVRERFARWVEPMHARHVQPSRKHADLVLDGRDPIDALVAAVLDRVPPALRCGAEVVMVEPGAPGQVPKERGIPKERGVPPTRGVPPERGVPRAVGVAKDAAVLPGTPGHKRPGDPGQIPRGAEGQLDKGAPNPWAPAPGTVVPEEDALLPPSSPARVAPPEGEPDTT